MTSKRQEESVLGSKLLRTTPKAAQQGGRGRQNHSSDSHLMDIILFNDCW